MPTFRAISVIGVISRRICSRSWVKASLVSF
jgi:hypothetical protein